MSKILYIWKGVYPWDVRVEKFCKTFIREKHEVILLCRWSDGEKKEEFPDGIHIIRVGYGLPWKMTVPVSYNPVWTKAISQAIQNQKPDLVIVREILLAETAGKLAKKYSIPVIMDMAENYPAAMKDFKKYKRTFLRRLFIHLLNIPETYESRSVPLMDGIVTVCIEQNERLIKKYKYPDVQMAIVHNTPDLKFFDGIHHGSSNPPIVFGHHGFMSAEKGLSGLVAAFTIAAKESDNIQLLLAGDGECFEDLKAQASASPYSNRIIFFGNYQYNDLKKILSRINIGVIPYLPSDFNNHTIHNKLFDFFAAGKPVIVSEAKPLKRIVNETNTGFVIACVNPNALAQKILEVSKMNLEDYSRNCLAAAKVKYNWENDSKVLTNFINKFLN